MTDTPDDPYARVPDAGEGPSGAAALTPADASLPQEWSTPSPADSTGDPGASAPAAPWGAPDATYAATYGAPTGAPTTTSAKAITSLVFSLVYLCGIGSALAVVLGHLARGEIKRSHGRVGGLGLATAGLILGYLGLVFTLVVGGAVAVAALNDGVGTSRQNNGADSFAPPKQPAPPSDGPRQVAPVSGVCPDVAALADVVPKGTTLVLFNSTRGVEDGVVDCVYTVNGQPPAQAPYVLVAVQDDVTTQSVEDYFTERELDPPADAQLGAVAGKADRFGFDTYDSPDSGIAYVDTGAARGKRSVVLSVPASFNVPETVLFATTVELLDGIRIPDNVI